MKKKNLVILYTTVLFLLSVTVFSQENVSPYKISGGIRMGFTSGLSAKYFLNDKIALEGIAGIRYFHGSGFTGLVEAHYPNVFDVENLYAYIGGGAHAGFFFWYNANGYWKNNAPNAPFFVGVDIIGGLEYKLPEYPLTLSFDLKPQLDVFGFYPDIAGGGLTLRYILK